MKLYMCLNFREADVQDVLYGVLHVDGYRAYIFSCIFILSCIITMQSQSELVIVKTLQLLHTKLKFTYFCSSNYVNKVRFPHLQMWSKLG